MLPTGLSLLYVVPVSITLASDTVDLSTQLGYSAVVGLIFVGLQTLNVKLNAILDADPPDPDPDDDDGDDNTGSEDEFSDDDDAESDRDDKTEGSSVYGTVNGTLTAVDDSTTDAGSVDLAAYPNGDVTETETETETGSASGTYLSGDRRSDRRSEYYLATPSVPPSWAEPDSLAGHDTDHGHTTDRDTDRDTDYNIDLADIHHMLAQSLGQLSQSQSTLAAMNGSINGSINGSFAVSSDAGDADSAHNSTITSFMADDGSDDDGNNGAAAGLPRVPPIADAGAMARDFARRRRDRNRGRGYDDCDGDDLADLFSIDLDDIADAVARAPASSGAASEEPIQTIGLIYRVVDGAVKIFDIETGEEVHDIPAHQSRQRWATYNITHPNNRVRWPVLGTISCACMWYASLLSSTSPRTRRMMCSAKHPHASDADRWLAIRC